MSTPAATLSHFSKGRIRIRISKKLGDKSYFTKLQNLFADLPGIMSAKGNHSAASLLLLTNLPTEDIFQFAKNNDLFEMKHEQTKKMTLTKTKSQKEKTKKTFKSSETALKRFANRVHDFDVAVQKSTYGILDLTTLAFGAFAGMGIYQIARGHVMASGTSLLATAFAMVPLQKVISERYKNMKAQSEVVESTTV